MNDLTRLALMV